MTDSKIAGVCVCPSCSGIDLKTFFTVDKAPTNSVLLLRTRSDALNFPTAPLNLTFCRSCGHIFNRAFVPQNTEYSGRYESTQAYSPTFNRFNRRLAQDLIERFDLRGKSTLEIGCGNGEFLVLLCELSGGRGIGFDPAYQAGRVAAPAGVTVDFVADFYGERYADLTAGFVVCKMTLEHIFETQKFMRMVRQTVDSNPEAIVFFQIPNGRYVLEEQAFWDVYYEHCSYFTAGSLRRLFFQEKFDVLDLWTDYDDQYLMIAARPANQSTLETQYLEETLAETAGLVDQFSVGVPKAIDGWRRFVTKVVNDDKTVALWGGGSKAVAFLTTIGLHDKIAFVVDINPNKAHAFLPDSGHEVVLPDYLTRCPVDVIIVMNPIYLSEIQTMCARIGQAPRLVGLAAEPEKAVENDPKSQNHG